MDLNSEGTLVSQDRGLCQQQCLYRGWRTQQSRQSPVAVAIVWPIGPEHRKHLQRWLPTLCLPKLWLELLGFCNSVLGFLLHSTDGGGGEKRVPCVQRISSREAMPSTFICVLLIWHRGAKLLRWIYLLKLHVCVYVYMYVSSMHACKSESNFSFVSFDHAGPGNWTQTRSLSGSHLYPLSITMAPWYLELNGPWPQHHCPMNEYGSNTLAEDAPARYPTVLKS